MKNRKNSTAMASCFLLLAKLARRKQLTCPMPYKKRRRRRKKGVLKKLIKKVNKISRSIELKHFTSSLGAPNVDDDGEFIIDLNEPDQGLLDTNRIGDSIFCTGVHVRLSWTIGGNNNMTQVRMILLWDKFNTVGDISDVLISVGNSSACLSHYNVDTRRDWIKLMDKSFILTSPSGSSFRQLNKFFKLNKKTQFLGGTETITKGRLKLLVISNADSAGTDPDKPNMLGFSRIFYQDA